MSRSALAVIIFTVSFAAGATLYMAWLASTVMPGWMAMLGPILLAATIVVHLRSRQ